LPERSLRFTGRLHGHAILVPSGGSRRPAGIGLQFLACADDGGRGPAAARSRHR